MSLFKRGNIWWMKRKVNGKVIRRSLGVRDKRAALLKQAEYLRSLELRDAGVETYAETRTSDVASVVDEYEAELTRRGRSPGHLRCTLLRVRRLLDGARSLADVTPKWIRECLCEVTRQYRLSGKTANYYRTALHGFFAWLIKEERWGKNPVATIERMAQEEPRRQRRALDRSEIQRLLSAAPRQRALVYWLAIMSGLRRGELCQLKWGDLDVERGTIRLRASTTKNRQDAQQVVPGEVLTALEARRGNARSGECVFRSIPRVETLRKDLAAAKVAEETDEGVIDFHSLRVTYATLLARAGVPLAQAQRLMRHSTPVLTANVYTKLGLEDGRSAVASISLDGLCPKLCPPSVATSHDPASNGASSIATAAPSEAEPLARNGEEMAGRKVEAPSGIEPEYADLQSAA